MRLYIIFIICLIITATLFTGCIQSSQQDNKKVQSIQATTTPVIETPASPKLPTKTSTKVAQWMAGVTCGNGVSHCYEIGGHISIIGFPEKLSIGETYKVDLKFDYEWTDHEPGDLSIQYMDVGFVTDSNLYGTSPEGSNVIIDYLTEPGINTKGGIVNPDWIGHDTVTLNKKIKVGESFSVTAYITILKKPQPSNAYLIFDMQGSFVLAGIPNSNYDPVRYQRIIPALAVKTVVE